MNQSYCKHLDFTDNKYSARKVTVGGIICWEREPDPDYPEKPLLVQFCRQRGRLNSPDACTTRLCALCSDYEPNTQTEAAP